MTLAAGRTRTAHRLAELRAAGIPIAQTAVAAGAAWWIAIDLLHHQSPLFAPISAIIALGLNAGYRTHRAVEMVLGVSLGVVIGDALIDGIGTGPLQMGLAVLLAMSAAVVLGAVRCSPLLGGAVGLAVLAAASGNPTLRMRARLTVPSPSFATTSAGCVRRCGSRRRTGTRATRSSGWRRPRRAASAPVPD